MILRYMLMIFIIVCFILQSALHVNALSCKQLTLQEAFEEHDTVVVGTVVNIKDSIFLKGGLLGAKEIETNVLLNVEESWKSQIKSQIIFKSDFSWGYRFEEGKKYLIYLHTRNEKYYNSPCSPTKEITSVDEVRQLFGEGQKPTGYTYVGYKMWFMIERDIDILIFLAAILLIFGLILKWGAAK